MKRSPWALLLVALQVIAAGENTVTIPTGPPVGTHVPDFQAVDQTGQMQTLASIAGPKGSLLVFFRSADW